MTFAELKAELLARGFNPVGDTRAGQMINSAMQELDQVALWPYREASATGESPLTITDLGTIETVTNETSHGSLSPADWTAMQGLGDLSVGGTPSVYYVAWPAAVPVVVTYPSNGDTIGVQYWAITPEMSDATDVPRAPSRYHEIIVDMAARRAYIDSDNFEAANMMQREIDRKLAYMTEALFSATTQGSGAAQAIVSGSEDW